MLKSKFKNEAISFIMGTDNVIKEKLDSIGAIYKVEDEKYYLTKIPKDKLDEYEKVIIEYLKPGFWNEYISDEVVFIFKNDDGTILRYIWSDDNEQEVLSLCNKFADFNKSSIKEIILGEQFYRKNITLEKEDF